MGLGDWEEQYHQLIQQQQTLFAQLRGVIHIYQKALEEIKLKSWEDNIKDIVNEAFSDVDVYNVENRELAEQWTQHDVATVIDLLATESYSTTELVRLTGLTRVRLNRALDLARQREMIERLEVQGKPLRWKRL